MRVLVVHNRYSTRCPRARTSPSMTRCAGWASRASRSSATRSATTRSSPPARSAGCVRASTPCGRCRPAGASWLRSTTARPTSCTCTTSSHCSPAACLAARRRGVPVVWTVHNRRLRCVAGGQLPGRSPVPAVPARLAHPRDRAPVLRRLDRRQRARERIQLAVPGDRPPRRRGPRRHQPAHGGLAGLVRRVRRRAVRVKYNAVDAARVPPTDPASRRRFVFAGRLALYKGWGCCSTRGGRCRPPST